MVNGIIIRNFNKQGDEYRYKKGERVFVWDDEGSESPILYKTIFNEKLDFIPKNYVRLLEYED